MGGCNNFRDNDRVIKVLLFLEKRDERHIPIGWIALKRWYDGKLIARTRINRDVNHLLVDGRDGRLEDELAVALNSEKW